jgi:hypothetical protein
MTGASRTDRGKLGGLMRGQIIRELAVGDMNQAELARKYDVTEGAITQFKQRNADAIAEVRANAEDEFAGLLIANKARRIAAYEDILRKAMQPTPKVDNKGGQVRDPETGEPVYEFNASAAMTALKNVAEEMGQLASRIQLQGDLTTTTTYKIAGVDPEDLT